LIYDVYDLRTLKFLIYIYTQIFKQSYESLYSAEMENFKWIIDINEVPWLFKKISDSYLKVDIEELFKEKLGSIRLFDGKQDLVNSLETYFIKNELRKEFFVGRILTIEKYFIYFPELLKYYYDTLEIILKDNDGSLPITWRYFIAIMV